MKKTLKTKGVRFLAGLSLTFLPLGALLAQPVVQVPPGCNVVYVGVGTGTVAGYGGIVGNNGIVVMPDPFDFATGAGDFTVNPFTATISGWSLLGDLSVQTTNVPPMAPLQSATGLTVNIESYNKNMRIPSEVTSPSSSLMARSKGRVIITYNDTTTLCGGSIQFDILKEYMDSSYVPPIIGPDCWLPDSTYTYSVDQIASDNLTDGIGLDKYYWYVQDAGGTVVPPGLFYTSADKSSITLTAPSVLDEPYTITCCYGRANPWDGDLLPFPGPGSHQKCVSKLVGGQPAQPMVNIPDCVDIGDPSFVASVVSPVGGYNYTWQSSNPIWLLNPGPMGHSVTVSSLGEGPGVITLLVSNGGCSSSARLDTVNRRFVSPDVYIDAPVTCLSAGLLYNYTFTVLPSGVQVNPTCWQMPDPSWIVTPLNGTSSSISIQVPDNFPPGTYTISAFSCACPTGVISINVDVRPETPVILSGPTCIDYGSTGMLTYVVDPPGIYNWTIPSGWSGSSSNETLQVTPNGTTVGTISVNGIGNNGCNSLGSASWTIGFNAIEPTSANIGCFNFGVDGTTTVTIGNVPSPFTGTYLVFSDPAGLLDTPPYSVGPTGTITLNTLGTASGPYTLHFVHATACDTSDTLSVNVTVSGLGVAIMPYYSMAYDLFQVMPPIGTAYQWFLDGTPIPVNTPFLILDDPGPGPTEVCVDVADNLGCVTRLCAPGGTHQRQPEASDDDPDRRLFSQINLFPNPNNGEFTLEMPEFRGNATLRIVDAGGRQAGSYMLKTGVNYIAEKNLAAGTYFLLIDVEGKTMAKKIQVTQK